MQVCGEDNGCREQALAVLALALAVQLLPPLVHERVARLVADHHFGRLALIVKNVANGSILVAIVFFHVRVVVGSLCLLCARHECVDIRTGHSDGQQTHSGENGVTAADIIRYNEGLVAFFVRKVLQRAARLIGRAENTLLCFFLAVLLLEDLAENTERDSRLRGGAGLGNHVDGNILALADLNQLRQRGGRNTVAGEIDVRRIFLQCIVVLALEELDCCACTEVGAADADDDKHIRVLLDALRSRLDACKFLFIVIGGQVHPTEEIISRTLAGCQKRMCILNLRSHCSVFVLADKALQVSAFQFQCHFYCLLFA